MPVSIGHSLQWATLIAWAPLSIWPREALQEAKLKLNTYESELYIPKWANLDMAILQQRQGVIKSDSSNQPDFRLDDGVTIPIAHKGLKILRLGCPAGANSFCAAQLDLLGKSIDKDLDLPKDVQYLHQRTKLAIYCCNLNTRATYLARSLPLALSEPTRQVKIWST